MKNIFSKKIGKVAPPSGTFSRTRWREDKQKEKKAHKRLFMSRMSSVLCSTVVIDPRFLKSLIVMNEDLRRFFLKVSGLFAAVPRAAAERAE